MTGSRIPALLAAALAAGLAVLPPAGAREAATTDRAAIFYYPWYSNPAKDGRWAHWYVEHEGAQVLSTPFDSAAGGSR